MIREKIKQAWREKIEQAALILLGDRFKPVQETIGKVMADFATEQVNAALNQLRTNLKLHEPHNDCDWRWIVEREINALKIPAKDTDGTDKT